MEPIRLADFVPAEPGVEDTHAEHLPNGDFVPPAARLTPSEADGDVSGELPRIDNALLGTLGFMGID